MAFLVIDEYAPGSRSVGHKAEVATPVRHAGLEFLSRRRRREHLDLGERYRLRTGVSCAYDHSGRRQADGRFQFMRSQIGNE